jgi:hypothetical protein
MIQHTGTSTSAFSLKTKTKTKIYKNKELRDEVMRSHSDHGAIWKEFRMGRRRNRANDLTRENMAFDETTCSD